MHVSRKVYIHKESFSPKQSKKEKLAIFTKMVNLIFYLSNFSNFVEIELTNINYIQGIQCDNFKYFKYINIYSEIIAVIKLICTSITSHSYYFYVSVQEQDGGRQFWYTYPLSKCKNAINTILLTIVAILYIRCLDLTHN